MIWLEVYGVLRLYGGRGRVWVEGHLPLITGFDHRALSSSPWEAEWKGLVPGPVFAGQGTGSSLPSVSQVRGNVSPEKVESVDFLLSTFRTGPERELSTETAWDRLRQGPCHRPGKDVPFALC